MFIQNVMNVTWLRSVTPPENKNKNARGKLKMPLAFFEVIYASKS